MRQQVLITLSKEDTANVRHLMEAWNLVGGPKDGAKQEAKSRRRHELDQDALEAKLFGKISTNQFTIDDVREAVAIIERRRRELYANCEDPVFLDPKLQDVWATGVKANADAAVRMAKNFLEDVKQDFMIAAEAA
jgi:predicted 2-oxoglutarate/Fe(II)-dependent dioxygenase YbiX